MKLGESKCTYLSIKHEKHKCAVEIFEINDTKIQEIENEMTYKWSVVYENISSNGIINRTEISSKWFKRALKIWFGDLCNYKKYSDHNSFAFPVLTQDCTKMEIGSMDVKTGKLLNMTGDCHPKLRRWPIICPVK